MNSQIVYLDVRSLVAHPDNPRKDLGDLTELAESIRVKGVMQNLTVVPMDGGENFRIVIGHRRAAAARKAGVETVPCVISEMDPREQLETMLLENIQRSDLTVLEQARGFQMMLDFGSSIDDIAQRTGFSASTVRRRVKLMELDQKHLERAVARGGSLMDYMELDQIADPALRDVVLCAIGTDNFKNALLNAKRQEKNKLQMLAWEAVISTFAKKIVKRDFVGEDSVPMDYVRSFAEWNTKTDTVDIPDDVGSVKYYYLFGRDQIELYSEHVDRIDPAAEARKIAKDESISAMQRIREVSKGHYQLRMDFVRDFVGVKKHFAEIAKLVGIAILYHEISYRDAVDKEAIMYLLGLEVKSSYEIASVIDLIYGASVFSENPERAIFSLVYAATDQQEKYWETRWDPNNQCSCIHHRENLKLNMLYILLCQLGYEMSDEERAMQDGTHELLQKSESSDTDDDIDDDTDDFDDDDEEDEEDA